jgi:hypothetical protein
MNFTRSASLLTNGSQWSAKGNDTALEPVIQLEIRQKAMPFFISWLGAALVNTKGSYPYVSCRA